MEFYEIGALRTPPQTLKCLDFSTHSHTPDSDSPQDLPCYDVFGGLINQHLLLNGLGTVQQQHEPVKQDIQLMITQSTLKKSTEPSSGSPMQIEGLQLARLQNQQNLGRCLYAHTPNRNSRISRRPLQEIQQMSNSSKFIMKIKKVNWEQPMSSGKGKLRG